MFGFWKAGLRLSLAAVETVALLPLYAKIFLALAVSGCFVLAADWDKIFRAVPSPPTIEETAVAQPRTAAAPAKAEDRVAAPAQPEVLKHTFTISDPHVGPDGSIRDGDDGHPFFLSELKSFTSKDVCTHANGERWACGLQAYATLRNSIEHRTIQCANRGSGELPKISCEIGGRNVALSLIKNGLVALKDDVENQDLLRAQAQAGRIGIWDR